MRLMSLLLMSILTACNPAAESSRSIADATRSGALTWSDGLYLPPLATNVYGYEKIGGLQDLELFYSFKVPLADVEAAVDFVTKACEKSMKFSYTFEKTSTLPSTYNWPHWVKSTIPWWKADKIAVGFYKGTSESYGVRAWADTRTGTIFVYQTD